MFIFADMPVRFISLLVLFTWCTVWSIYELTRPQGPRQRVSNTLHLVMSALMLIMVAPVTWKNLIAVIPTMVWVGVFALSTAWFIWLAIDALRSSDRHGGLHFVGHAAMFGAMTWHLWAMAVMHRAKMAGLGDEWMMAQRMPGGVLWIFALAGLPIMTYLLISSMRSLWQATQRGTGVALLNCACGPDCDCGPECSCYVKHAEAIVREPVLVGSASAAPARRAAAPAVSTHTCSEVRPVGTLKYRLSALSAFAMNFGMFWMSTGLMVAILPFFKYLAF